MVHVIYATVGLITAHNATLLNAHFAKQDTLCRMVHVGNAHHDFLSVQVATLELVPAVKWDTFYKTTLAQTAH